MNKDKLPEKFVKLKEVDGIEIYISPGNSYYYARSEKHRLSAEGETEEKAIKELKHNIAKYGNIIGLISEAYKSVGRIPNFMSLSKDRFKFGKKDDKTK